MQHTNHSSSPFPSTPLPLPAPSRQNKAILQRDYREKESESFDRLRDVIRIITGEELRTRQEVLRKAIDLLLSLSGIENRTKGHANTTMYEAPTSTSELEVTPLAQSGLPLRSHSAQSSQQNWPSNAQLDAVTQYGTHFHSDRQHYVVPTMGFTFSYYNSPGSGEDSSDYPQFSTGRPF